MYKAKTGDIVYYIGINFYNLIPNKQYEIVGIKPEFYYFYYIIKGYEHLSYFFNSEEFETLQERRIKQIKKIKNKINVQQR